MPSFNNSKSNKDFEKIASSNSLLDSGKELGAGLSTGLVDEALIGAAKKTNLVDVAKNVKPNMWANLGVGAVGIAANPLINLAEANIIGPQNMYLSRYKDVLKNIQAIQKLIPNDNKINTIIQQLQQALQQGSQLFQKKASYNNKNIKLAIIGEFNTGQYARDAAIGAGTGFMSGALAGGVGAIPGAALGFVGGGLGSAAYDIAYQFKNNFQKASWQAGELQLNLKTLADQLEHFSPQLGNMLQKLGQDIKNEIEVRFEKKSGANYKNEYDQAAQQGQQQGQQQQEGMPQLDPSNLDQNLSQAVNTALQIYAQARQAYYVNPQMYEQLRMQYQQILQEINAYIAQNYPGQDANQVIAIYMQQANFGMQEQQIQQPMQQQPMMQQPMIQQPMIQQGYNQQNYYQPGTFQQGYMQQPSNQQMYMQQPMTQQAYMQQPFNQQMYMQQQPQANYLR
jgi:hypothetical protein